MHSFDEYEPAEIGVKCRERLDRVQAEMSQANHKDIILVAYEKK